VFYEGVRTSHPKERLTMKKYTLATDTYRYVNKKSSLNASFPLIYLKVFIIARKIKLSLRETNLSK
jgi:hypothetical protein